LQFAFQNLPGMILQAGFMAETLDRSLYDMDSARWRPYQRLEYDRYFQGLFGLGYHYGSYRLDFQINSQVNLGGNSFTLYHYNGYETVGEAASRSVITPAINAGLGVKFYPSAHSMLILGLEGGAAFHVEGGDGIPYSVEQARLEDQGLVEESAALSDANAFLYSWFVRPSLQFVLPDWDGARLYQPTLTLGVNLADDQIGLSDNGNYFLNGFPTFMGAAVLGFRGSLNFGRERRLQVPLFFQADLGNYYQVRGGAGLGWNFDAVTFQATVGGSYYTNNEPSRNIYEHGRRVTWSTLDIGFSLFY
jgi:hypothetical protein